MSEDEVNILEEGNRLNLDFSKLLKISRTVNDVIPVAVQDNKSKEIILIAYTNEIAFNHTIKTKIVTFWSSSRNELWIKGNTSGNTFSIKKIFVNCEQNSLVYVVEANQGGICHTSNRTGKPRNCYYRSLNLETLELENIDP
ncbi:MAG: phosphoribosyl-AMP cyclohydrolase [Chitinispirillia bacterium]|jgi:phosphoribosyl-AMP cyclohydrolase